MIFDSGNLKPFLGRVSTPRCLRLYDLVEHSSHSVVLDEGLIVLASDQFKAAA